MRCGIRLNRLLLLLPLLLLLSLPLFSEVVLTDQEWQEILTALEGSETALMNSQLEVTELEKDLKNSNKIITMLLGEQTISDRIIAKLQLESGLQLKSLKQRKNVQIIRDLKIFAAGVIAGGAGGFAGGIKVGATLRL